MRACSDTTRVPGCSGSAATLPRTTPSTRRPPLKKTLPSMRVVAPIRLSILFCGLLSLRNIVITPSWQGHASRHFGVARASFVHTQLHARHLRLRAHPEDAFDPLEVLEAQAKCRRVGVPRTR